MSLTRKGADTSLHLKIGDYVTFRTAKADAFMSAEGILLEDLYVSPNITSLNDALFCVHLPRQYSASRELDDYLLQLKQLEEAGQGVDKNDKNVSNFINALRRGRDNEQKLNNRYMTQKKGQEVKFGDTIQLYHVKSGKYLTIQPTELAVTERENIRISLSGAGSMYSALVLMPRFKIDREGDVVVDNTDLYLTVSERRSEYLHCADRESVSGSLPEINCSLEPTPWKMSIFQSANDTADPLLILSSQLVYILDPETNSALMAAKAREESEEKAPEGGRKLDEGEDGEDDDEEEEEEEEEEEDEEKEAKGAGRRLEDGSALSGGDGDEEEEKDAERLVLRELDAKGHIDTRMLWMFEFRSKIQGGPILWRTAQVRIKNLCSGCYLKVDAYQKYSEEEEMMVSEYVLGTTKDSSHPGTMYSLSEVTGTSKLLTVGKAYHVKSEQGGFFLERGDEDTGMRGAHMLRTTKEKASATNFQLMKFSQADEDPENIKQREPLDVYVAMATRDYLQKYLGMTVLPKVSHANTLWPSADRTDLEIFLAVIRRSIIFSQGFPISATKVVLGVDKSDVTLAKSRQRNMREQGILDILLALVDLLIPLSQRTDEIAAMPRAQQPTLSIEEIALNKMGNILLEKSMDLLYFCILDNEENQMHVADNIRTLLAHLGSQPIAGKCVTEMLSKNKELQETKIGDEEIEIFVGKLRSSKMNSMYLELLKACCSCMGDGVDGNQCRVTEHIFADTNDIIIHIHADYTKIVPVDWKPDGLYLPEAPVPGSPVQGENLYLSGLPQLSLSWTTNSIDYSPLGLFGKLSVNVRDLYATNKQNALGDSPSKSGASSASQAIAAKKSASASQKEAVGNYFVSQMLLCAEMAMDRNYVAMHKIDTLFSYEVLVTILKLQNVQDPLKAAAARLVRCLHVDRDPQAPTKIPVLTRSWSSVVKQSTPKLPFVGDSRKYVFGLLQQILADYVSGMAGVNWTTLAKSMLELYSALINFNFYGTPERMQDVINPLIRAIDRRTLLYPGDAEYVTPSDQSGRGDSELGATAQRMDKTSLTINGDDEGKEEDPDATKEELDPAGDANAEEGAEDGKVESWKQHAFDLTESIPYLLSVLLLVIAAVAVTLWAIIGAPDLDDSPSSPLGIWGLIVLALFILDVTIRGYLYRWKHGKIMPFFMSVFNQIDLLVISIDIIFLGLPTDGSNTSLTKTLRLVRMVRLLRLFRVAKIVQAVVETMQETDVDSFKMPLRYSKAPLYELDAMVEIMDTLLYASRVITDRNISIFLYKFQEWQAGRDRRSPEAIFEDIIEEGKLLTLGVPDMDLIFLDCIMFVHTPLVQGALDVIMFHHQTRRTLLTNAANVQLLVSSKRERQLQQIQSMLQTLEQNAETHELWGELQSEADFAVNKQTKDILKELTELCSTTRFTLDLFQGPRTPDVEIQNLYNNLGFFDIALKLLDLFEGVEPEEDGTFSDVALNTRDLCLLCNDVLYWFALDNASNQEQLYSQLDFFLGSLDGEIKSHLVVKAMFSTNEKLMKLVPHSNLSTMIEHIFKIGRSHHYLTLLQSITHVGSRNIAENQYEIVRVLTQGGRLNKLGLYFVPRMDKKYSAKCQQMEQCRGLKDPSPEDLTAPLAYYATLLDIFSGCATGRGAVSSLEAKIQSIYAYIDVIECVLDVRSLLYVKLLNLKYLFNCVIDVSLPVPGLVEAAAVWKLINLISDKLGKATDYMKKVQELGWDHPECSRHEMEFAIMGVMLVAVFYEKYYNRELFMHEGGAAGDERVRMNQAQADAITSNLFTRIRALWDLNSPRFGTDVKDWLKRAMTVLNRSCSVHIEPDIEAALALRKDAYSDVERVVDETQEQVVHRKYQEFLDALNNSAAIQKAASDENVEFITVLESLPYVADKVTGDLRYELLIKKVVRHVRENMSIIDNETRIDNRVTITTKWLITSFRAMIENKMGMSIYERDEDGGEKQDTASHQVKTALNTCGATALCLDLIVDGIDPELQVECIRLLVGLLFLEGGNREVQGLMNKYLSRPQAFLFFKQVSSILEDLTAWHSWQGDVVLEESQSPDDILPPSILIVRMLQLMSEGHYGPNQELMREQPDSDESVNLLDTFVVYLKTLSHHPCRTSTAAGIRLAATVVEILQGPCKGNQEHLALNTDILETCNRMLRSKKIKDCQVEEELELKSTVVALLQGILEGQSMHGPIYERVLSVMHVDVIQLIALEAGDPDESGCEDYPLFKTSCLVLLNMLVESRPSIKKEFGIPDDLKAAAGEDSNIGSVEIFWNDEMHRRYFHIPEVCSLLAKASKDQLVEANNRESQELKLIDFLERARGLYREVKHQEYLVSVGLNAIYSRRNQEITTWFSFVLAVTINFLYISYYQWSSSPTDDPENATIGYPDEIQTVINVLNYFQIISSFFTLSSMLVVREPVVYQTFLSEGLSPSSAALWTALDGKTLYYVWYFTFSVLGAAVNDQFVTFLLLDLIMKNSTAQNVLNAIIVPRWNIFWALVITEIVNYIFSFHLFNNFAFDIGVDDGQFQFGNDFCYSLWNCLKMTTDYGARLGGGIGDAFRHTYGKRWLLDTMYFFAIIICVFNLVAGVVITTFGKLREEKNERMRDTTEVCFICGVDKQIFDRAANDPNGFKIHIRDDHLMWNYMYFIFYIWEQDKDDDDGLEYYVRHRIDAMDIEWLPMNKAMRLDQAASIDEQMRQEFRGKLEQSKETINGRVKKLQTNIVTILEQLNLALKKDHQSALGAEDDDLGGFFNASASRHGGGDDFSVVSLGGTLASRIILPRRVNLLVIEVCGLRLPSSQMDTVSVRVECEEGIWSCPAETIDVSAARVALQADKLLVASEAVVNDTRHVDIFVCARNRVDMEVVLGTLQVSLVELMECDGVQSEKVFMCGEDVCSVLLVASSIIVE